MKEIRLHGRGGEGIALSAEMLVAAYGAEGRYAAGLPSFGVERRGSPVTAFVRFDDQPIKEKTRVYFPDCVVVVNPGLASFPDTFAGLKAGGMLVLNSPVIPENKPHGNIRVVAAVDATRIAIEELGRPITNSCMLGALAGATGWLKLESVTSALEHYFEGDVLRRNVRSAERGFREVKTSDWPVS